MAFTETGFKAYAVRDSGNVRTWFFGSTSGNGNTTGQLLTQPRSVLVEVFGTFAGSTVAVQFSTDNVTYAALANAPLVFTAAGLLSVHPNDCRTGYYRLALTTVGNPSLVANMLSVGSLDVL